SVADIRLESSHRAIRRHGGANFMLYCNKALPRDSARALLSLILVKKLQGDAGSVSSRTVMRLEDGAMQSGGFSRPARYGLAIAFAAALSLFAVFAFSGLPWH